jgi:hypothetical protein
MRSSYEPTTPASLLFETLAYDCKTDDERTAINKILATTGGEDTVAAARKYAKQKISGLDATIKQLEAKLDDLTDRGITKLPVNVLTKHQLSQATTDKTRYIPLYSAALASLENTIKAMEKSSKQGVSHEIITIKQ